jgi:hypothetical protein
MQPLVLFARQKFKELELFTKEGLICIVGTHANYSIS